MKKGIEYIPVLHRDRSANGRQSTGIVIGKKGHERSGINILLVQCPIS